MLKYEMAFTDCNEMVYHYMPEGKGEAGSVSINLKTGKISLISASTDDFGNRYAFKMMKRLEELFAASDMRKNGTIAWY